MFFVFDKKLVNRIVLLLVIFILLLSSGIYGKTTTTAAVSSWTIPEYGQIAWNTYNKEMNSFDATSSENIKLNSTAALLIEASSGRVLYELDADGKRYPASITKVISFLVIQDAILAEDIALTDKITYSEAAVGQDGSKSGHLVGDVDTVSHSLELMMVISANDAAYALAEYVGGDIPSFVERMNVKARELGMTSTSFVNPNGLHDENHYTTARDLATLAGYCLKNDTIMEYAGMESTVLPDGKTAYNSNKLLFWLEGTSGLKTGTTVAAGHCLIATATRGDMTLIAVVLAAPKEYYNYIDAAKLFTYGFTNYHMETFVKKGSAQGEASVKNCRESTVTLVSEESIGYPLAEGEEIYPEIVTETSTEIDGGHSAGYDGGDIMLFLDGEKIGSCDLVTTEDTRELSIIGKCYRKFSEFFSSVTGMF